MHTEQPTEKHKTKHGTWGLGPGPGLGNIVVYHNAIVSEHPALPSSVSPPSQRWAALQLGARGKPVTTATATAMHTPCATAKPPCTLAMI